MDISIIIPIYNSERFLASCLESVLYQDFTGNFEIICVNDGSNDESLKVLNDFAIRFNQIIVINQENSGPGKTRNEAIKKARGKYLFFLDSDDFLLSNTILSEMFEKSEKYNLEIIMGNIEYILDDESKNYPINRTRIPSNQIIKGEELLNYDMKFMFSVNKLYLRNYLLKNELLFIEGIIYEDCEFTPRAYFLAKRVMFLNNLTYGYRQHDSSITRRKIPKKDVFIVLESLKKFSDLNKSSVIANTRLTIAEKLILSQLIRWKDRRKYRKEIKQATLISDFLHSSKKYFKLYGLAYILRIHFLFEFQDDLYLCLKKIGLK